MGARHCGARAERAALLTQDETFAEPSARALIAQVDAADFSPPKRAKILDFAARQDFPSLPDCDDPDCGNVDRGLHFPDAVYEHIAEYREAKAHAN
jgi:hypothetical protein